MKYLLCESWLFLILYFQRQNAKIKTKVANKQKWKLADFQKDFMNLIKFQPVSCLVSLRQWFLNMRLQISSADPKWEFVRKANSKPTSTHWARSSQGSDTGICLVKHIPGDPGAHQLCDKHCFKAGTSPTAPLLWNKTHPPCTLTPASMFSALGNDTLTARSFSFDVSQAFPCMFWSLFPSPLLTHS